MSRKFTAAGVCGLALAALGLLSSCQEPLFVPTAPRSPYERFMVLRGQYRAPVEQNALGGEEPSLRQRLAPLDQP